MSVASELQDETDDGLSDHARACYADGYTSATLCNFANGTASSIVMLLQTLYASEVEFKDFGEMAGDSE